MVHALISNHTNVQKCVTVQLTVVVLRHIARQPGKINHPNRILQAFCRTPYKEINIEEERIKLSKMTYNLRFE